MNAGKPLTGLFNGTTLYILMKDKYNQSKEEGKCYVIQPILATCEYHTGCAYFKFIICEDVDWSIVRTSEEIVGVIFLPLLDQNMLLQMSNQNSFKGIYSVIASDWRLMVQNGTFQFPDHSTYELK